MKQLLLVVASVMCICYTTQSFAQTVDNETITQEKSIILDDKGNESETTIEIKNGKLYVDGKKVSDIDKNTEIKIVKKNTITEKHNFDLGRMDIPFSPKMKSLGTISRKAMLGVRTQDASPGAEVMDVVKGSAAEKAGLQKGDIIIAIDEDNIRTSQELAEKIAKYEKGTEVKIQIERNGRADNLMAQLEAPKADKVPFNNLPGTGRFSLPFQELEDMMKLGGDWQMLSNTTSTPQLGIEVEESEDGIEVVSVTPNSAADKAGIQKGDEIKTVEGQSVNDISTLQNEIMRNKDNKKMYFGVQRGGTIKSLPVVLPQAKRRAQF